MPYCELNEQKSKDFLEKFHDFTKNNFKVSITWKTKKVRLLFHVKDKNDHPSCKIYKGECSCGSQNIGETKRNVTVGWAEHNNPNNNSEPAKHLSQSIEHSFTWTVISQASKNNKTRKNLEASFIALLKPDLNEQCEFNTLVLFRNGVT